MRRRIFIAAAALGAVVAFLALYRFGTEFVTGGFDGRPRLSRISVPTAEE
jgi:hypothetical protein